MVYYAVRLNKTQQYKGEFYKFHSKMIKIQIIALLCNIKHSFFLIKAFKTEYKPFCVLCYGMNDE